MIFDPKYFKKMDFSQRQIENYFILKVIRKNRNTEYTEYYDDE
jgi:hypothetical protein